MGVSAFRRVRAVLARFAGGFETFWRGLLLGFERASFEDFGEISKTEEGTQRVGRRKGVDRGE